MCDLHGSVPDRHIESADGDTALAVAARLFAGHHDLSRTERVEVCPGLIHDVNFASRQQARREPLPNETALREAADRPKAVPDNGLPFLLTSVIAAIMLVVSPARRHRWVGVTGDRQR